VKLQNSKIKKFRFFQKPNIFSWNITKIQDGGQDGSSTLVRLDSMGVMFYCIKNPSQIVTKIWFKK